MAIKITDKLLTSLLHALQKFEDRLEPHLAINEKSGSMSKHSDEGPWPWPVGYPDEEKSPSVAETAREEGIRFIHFQNENHPCTIAYKQVQKRGNLADVAVAYLHPNDQFNKKIGVSIAADRLMNGQSVRMPILNKDKYITHLNFARAFADFS